MMGLLTTLPAFALLLVLLEITKIMQAEAITPMLTRDITFIQNLYGSLSFNKISATTSKSLTSSKELNSYKMEQIESKFLVIKVIFKEPIYIHSIEQKLHPRNYSTTEQTNVHNPRIVKLGKHEQGALNNIVNIKCNAQAKTSNDNRYNNSRSDQEPTSSYRVEKKHFCSIKTFDRNMLLEQSDHHGYCMYDLTASRDNDLILSSKINLVYDSLSYTHCNNDAPNVLCILLPNNNNPNYDNCFIEFNEKNTVNSVKKAGINGKKYLGNFKGIAIQSYNSSNSIPIITSNHNHKIHMPSMTAFVGMDSIAFHEFLNEPFYKNAYGVSDSKENMTILSPAVENAEHELGVLKRGQCKLLRKFYNNKTKEAQNALRYGAKLTDGTIISAVELHATLHEMMQAATGNKEGQSEDPKDGAGEIWEILLGAIPSLLMKLFAAEDPRSKEEMVHTLNEQLPATLGAEVPHIVAEMLEHALTYNLTNILTDSVTAAVEPRVSSSVFEGVSGPIEFAIYHHTTNRVPHAVSKTVIPTLAERTNRALPRFLERALACRLVFTLTRSISHAVVPTLSKSLTHNKDQDYYCYLCYNHKRHCQLCHNSPQNSYYNNYYGAYYTDYYSKYYSEYYGESCTKKKLEWPDAPPEPPKPK
jgi:hypothetical protein